VRTPLALHIFELDSSTLTECCTRFRNAAQELRMMLKTILEPRVFRFEPDQHARRTAVPSNEDLLLFREPEILR